MSNKKRRELMKEWDDNDKVWKPELERLEEEQTR